MRHEKSSALPVWVWVAISVSIFSLLGCCGLGGFYALVVRNAMVTEKGRAAAEVVDASDLFAAYQKNPAEAATKYGQSPIRVRLRADQGLQSGQEYEVRHLIDPGNGFVYVEAKIPLSHAAKATPKAIIVVYGQIWGADSSHIWIKDGYVE